MKHIKEMINIMRICVLHCKVQVHSTVQIQFPLDYKYKLFSLSFFVFVNTFPR